MHADGNPTTLPADQPTLFKAPKPVAVNLKPNQQTAWDLIRSTPGGVTADEIGAAIHQHTDQRPRCDYCTLAGRQTATSVALKELVVYRRASRKYEPRNPADRAVVPSAQLTELPSDLFGEAA
jgi:hypothetical protein